MQSKQSRVALLAVAAIVAVAAFVVLSPEDEDEPAGPGADAETPAGETTAGGDGSNRSGPTDDPEPKVTEIRIQDGELSGGLERIEVQKGETIEFVVTSDAPDEIHVHGYEVTKRVQPGRPTRFRFPADLEGVYEVEAHEIGNVPIAELKVTP